METCPPREQTDEVKRQGRFRRSPLAFFREAVAGPSPAPARLIGLADVWPRPKTTAAARPIALTRRARHSDRTPEQSEGEAGRVRPGNTLPYTCLPILGPPSRGTPVMPCERFSWRGAVALKASEYSRSRTPNGRLLASRSTMTMTLRRRTSRRRNTRPRTTCAWSSDCPARATTAAWPDWARAALRMRRCPAQPRDELHRRCARGPSRSAHERNEHP